MAKYTLLNFPSDSEFVEYAVTDFKRLATEAISARGKFYVALSGGHTPKHFYEALAQSDVEWGKIHLYFVDERYVSQTDPMSNLAMVQKALLSHIQIPPNHVHAIKTHFHDPHESARAYEAELAQIRFDLIYLGIGADGHTASLFPRLLIPINQRVTAFYVQKLGAYRISLLPDFINEAREIRFLVAGPEKKAVLDYILQDPEPAMRYPCQLIRACEILSYGI